MSCGLIVVWDEAVDVPKHLYETLGAMMNDPAIRTLTTLSGASKYVRTYGETDREKALGYAMNKMTKRPEKRSDLVEIEPIVESDVDLAGSPLLAKMRAEVIARRASGSSPEEGFEYLAEKNEIDFRKDPLRYMAVVGGEAQDADGNLIPRADAKFDIGTMAMRSSTMIANARRDIARTASKERSAGLSFNGNAKLNASSEHINKRTKKL